jgi:hypothetical protein
VQAFDFLTVAFDFTHLCLKVLVILPVEGGGEEAGCIMRCAGKIRAARRARGALSPV